MSVHGGDVFFDIKANKKPFDRTMSSIDSQVGKIAGGIKRKLAAAFTVAAFGKLINDVSKTGDEIDKMSQKVGMSSKAYQEWEYIMQRCGTSMNSMKASMKTLANAAAKNNSAFAELGITQQEIASMSQEELFARTIKGLQGVSDVTHRTYLASQLLGRGATELGAVLNLTAAQTEQMRQHVNALGGVMSEQAVLNSARFRDALLDVRMAFQGVGNVIATYVIPVLVKFINGVLVPAIVLIGRLMAKVFGFFSSKGNPFVKGADAAKNAINGVLGKRSQKSADKMANSVGGVGSNLGKTGKSAKGAKKEVQALKRELMGFDQITKLTKQDPATGTTGSSGIGGGGGIDAGGIDFSEAENDASSFSNKISEIFGRIQIPDKLQTALTHLKQSFSDLFDTLSNAGKWAYENILVPLGKWTINELAPAGVEYLASTVDLLNAGLKLLGAVIEKAWEPLIKPFFSFLGGVAVTSVETVAKVLKTAAQQISDFADHLDEVNKLSDLTISVKFNNLMPDWLKTIINMIIDSSVFGFDIQVGVKIAKAFTDIKQWLDKHESFDLIANFRESVSEGFKKIFGWITGVDLNSYNVDVNLTGKLTKVQDCLDEGAKTVTSIAKFATRKDALTDDQKTFGTKANFKSRADSLSEGEKTFGSKANFKSRTDNLSDAEKTFTSKAKVKTVKDSRSASQRQLSFKGVIYSIKSFIKGVTFKAGGGIYKGGHWHDIATAATGGAFDTGQMFIAREAGPELVGTIGGHTAVVNNDQIVASVSSGVAKAISGLKLQAKIPQLAVTSQPRAASPTQMMAIAKQAVQETGGGNSELVALLRELLTAVNSIDPNVYLDGESIKKNVVRRINDNTRMTGELELLW